MAYKELSMKKFLRLHAKLVLKGAVVLCCVIFSACSTSVIEFEKRIWQLQILTARPFP